MSILSENLKHLRAEKELSQQALADKLTITRGAYQKYEEGKSEPPHTNLIKISNFYGVTIDILLQIDLRKTNPEDLLSLNNRLLFPVQVNKEDAQTIEIIPESAQAGYTLGYSDPEFIESLDTMSLPFLGSGKYRTFPISGDSMLPKVKDGSYVVGEYVEHPSEIKNGKTYIIITKDEGMTYKRVEGGVGSLKAYPDNSFFDSYSIALHEIKEIWEFKAAIILDDEKPTEISNEQIMEAILSLKGN